MKLKNRSTLERAAGIVDGVSYAVDERLADILAAVVEMIDAVLIDEERSNENAE